MAMSTNVKIHVLHTSMHNSMALACDESFFSGDTCFGITLTERGRKRRSERESKGQRKRRISTHFGPANCSLFQHFGIFLLFGMIICLNLAEVFPFLIVQLLFFLSLSKYFKCICATKPNGTQSHLHQMKKKKFHFFIFKKIEKKTLHIFLSKETDLYYKPAKFMPFQRSETNK